MAQFHMRDLVADNHRQGVFAGHLSDQPAKEDDVAAKRRKSIDRRIVQVLHPDAHAHGQFLRGNDTIGQLLQVGAHGAGRGKVGGKP